MENNKMWLALGTTALGCLIAGFGGGFWIGKKKTELEAFHIANLEVAEARLEYKAYWQEKYEEKLAALTADNLLTLDEAVEEPMVGAYSEADVKASEEMLNEMPEERIRSQYVTVTEEPPVQEPVRVKPPVPVSPETRIVSPRSDGKRPLVQYASMFKADVKSEPEVEEKDVDDPVDPMAPYDISEETYFDGSPEYQQRQLNWYAPDNVLTDMADKPFDEPNLVVGDCLDVFANKDPETDNVLYVCNPRLKMVFEITRIHEDFAESVQGLMR